MQMARACLRTIPQQWACSSSDSEALRLWRLAAAQGDELAQQYVEQLTRELAEAAAASPPPPLTPQELVGSRVELHGLTSKKHKKLKLNGCSGVVVAFDAETGRCGVELDDGRGPFQIPPENLHTPPLMDPPENLHTAAPLMEPPDQSPR